MLASIDWLTMGGILVLILSASNVLHVLFSMRKKPGILVSSIIINGVIIWWVLYILLVLL